jgi:hypothetical protein
MLVWLDIAVEGFERLIRHTPQESRLYTLIINGIVMYDPRSGIRRKIIRVLCKREEADIILNAVKESCPEAAQEVEDSITRADFSG